MTAQQEGLRLSLSQHPLSAAFPAMSENEIEALALDIEQHGQREPGVLFEGAVLDGWHRYRACHRLGIQFKAAEFEGEDPVAFVKSKNWHRRHLTQSQKAATEVALRQWAPRGQGKSAPGADYSTTAEMAKEAGVSQRTIEQAKAAVSADPALGEAVKDGKVSAKAAAEMAKLSPAKRDKALQAIQDGKPLKAREKKTKSAPGADFSVERLEKLVKELEEQKDDLADTARELSDKLAMFEATEPDEQQKLIATLQKTAQRKDGEIARLTAERNRLQDKCNQLIRQVKALQKNAG